MLRLVAVLAIAAAPLDAQSQIRTVRGEIRDTAGNPLEGVEVVALLESRIARTNADGSFTLDSIALGEQRLLFRRLGYHRVEITIVLDKETGDIIARLTPVGVTLNPVVVSARRTGLFGVVGDLSYRPISGAEIQVIGGGRTTTDSTGQFNLPKVRGGSYMIQIRKQGHYAVRRSVTIPRGESQELSVLLLPLPSDLSDRTSAAASGYGNRIAWVLDESDSRRMRCGGGSSVLVPREELADAGGQGSLDLVLARARSVTGKSYGEWELRQYRLFVDGQNASGWPLSGIRADDVEAVEIYKGSPGQARLAQLPNAPWRSFGGGFAPWRPELSTFGGCPKGTIWVWLR